MIVLSSAALLEQLQAEVARVRRLGGFLSLALVGPPGASLTESLRVDPVLVRERLRVQDTLGWYGANVLSILMPGSDLRQAASAMRRLLSSLAGHGSISLAIGIAATYGEVDGGPEALLQAAEEAHRRGQPGEVKESPTLRGSPHVLVVDDDAPFASALADTLVELGWEGHPCSDHRDAVERVRSRTYDALFLDVMMPGRSGPEILQESHRYHPRRPVVLMSGQDVDRGTIVDAMLLGPVIFIRKPISPEDMASALQLFRGLLPGSIRREHA